MVLCSCPSMRILTAAAIVLCLAPVVTSGQSSPAESKLLLENADVLVTRSSVPRDTVPPLSFKSGDGVIVPLQKLTWSAALAANSEFAAGPGEAVVFPQGSSPQVYQAKDAPPNGAFIQVILKHHYATPFRKCEEPKECVRPIRIGDQVIGETRSLFTNNYISAYRHQLVPGGTLASSYFTSRGTDHALFIAITPLSANFSGEEITLEAGQVYFSTAQQVEVTAGAKDAVWVAIRIHAQEPKS